MCNYSSAKVELLALKWAVTEKFQAYQLRSEFMAFTNNNPLAYIKASKLGASQIHWLSKLALFDFNIQYHPGKTNKVSDALSQHLINIEPETEGDRDNDSEVVLLYATIFNTIDMVLKDTKIPYAVKKKCRLLVVHWKGRLA